MRNPVINDTNYKKLALVCIICKEPTEGWYGPAEIRGTCSAKCEKIQSQKPKYPDHTEEDFLKRFNL